MFYNCLNRIPLEGDETVLANPTEIQIFSGTGTYFAVPTDSNVLPEHAFEGFTELEEVFIPKAITKLSADVFAPCKNLKKIVWQTKSSSTKKKNAPWGAPSTCQVEFNVKATPKVVEQDVTYLSDDTIYPVEVPDNSETVNATNYHDEMLKLLTEIRQYSKKINYPSMIMIGNGGINIYEPNSTYNWTQDKIKKLGEVMDGACIEDVWYGTDKNWNIADDKPTPASFTKEFLSYIQMAQNVGVTPFILDYASTPANVTDFYNKCTEHGFNGYCSYYRELCSIPTEPIFQKNDNAIYDFKDIKSYFALLNPNFDENPQFSSKEDYIEKLSKSNADLLILDIFYGDDVLKTTDVKKLKHKPNGKLRKIIAYCSLGEAEDYRPYWNSEWSVTMPNWIDKENPDWKGNYKVKFWTNEWKKILFGTRDSYIDTIMRLGFDGLFLDVIDAYEYFEEN